MGAEAPTNETAAERIGGAVLMLEAPAVATIAVMGAT